MKYFGLKQGIDDTLIQPYSGHSSRQSLEVYSRLSIEEAQKEFDGSDRKFYYVVSYTTLPLYEFLSICRLIPSSGVLALS
jgi:hypothetical protein